MIGGKDVAVSSKGDQRIEVTFVPEAMRADAAKAVDQSIETIRRRIDSLGTKEPSINRQGTNRIMIQAAGESDPSEDLRGSVAYKRDLVRVLTARALRRALERAAH